MIFTKSSPALAQLFVGSTDSNSPEVQPFLNNRTAKIVSAECFGNGCLYKATLSALQTGRFSANFVKVKNLLLFCRVSGDVELDCLSLVLKQLQQYISKDCKMYFSFATDPRPNYAKVTMLSAE